MIIATREYKYVSKIVESPLLSVRDSKIPTVKKNDKIIVVNGIGLQGPK